MIDQLMIEKRGYGTMNQAQIRGFRMLPGAINSGCQSDGNGKWMVVKEYGTICPSEQVMVFNLTHERAVDYCKRFHPDARVVRM